MCTDVVTKPRCYLNLTVNRNHETLSSSKTENAKRMKCIPMRTPCTQSKSHINAAGCDYSTFQTADEHQLVDAASMAKKSFEAIERPHSAANPHEELLGGRRVRPQGRISATMSVSG